MKKIIKKINIFLKHLIPTIWFRKQLKVIVNKPTKKSAFADLVHLTDLLNDWIDTLKSNVPLIKMLVKKQKTRLSASNLTEYNAGALHPDLSNYMLPYNNNDVKFVLAMSLSNVDLTGIEPANPGFLDPDVYQHQAHYFLAYQITKYWVNYYE